ncbi:MAG: 7-carboxy-7-deazaguanine synthase QueE [Magnetococcales bacterium]|nr:7-carboxy-7-deazaguanine synthase QueE [Magnetococcales bacterium]NGZ28278.1 7-carboxy-7-deazaguanine synthase QueE [Magnetococcales bacterium]
MTSYPICDLFASIQGEGSWTGRPVVFVRFSGCPLRCDWCDEPLHRDPQAVRRLNLDELLREITSVGAGIPSVVLTGGEPLIQPGLQELILALKQQGYWVAMETSGVGGVFPIELDWITLSPKTSLTDECYQSAHEIKFVIVAPLDPNLEQTIGHWMERHGRVLVQPVARNETMDPEAARLCYQLVMASRGRLRLSLQTHRWLGVR